MEKLPKTWEIHTLGDFIDRFESGVSVNAEDTPATNGDFGVLKLSCVSGGIFNPKENKRILATEISKARVPPRKGCIIISRSNTTELVGANAYVEEDHPGLFLPDTLWQSIYREDVTFSSKWLSCVLQSPAIRRSLGNLASGTSGSMKKLTRATVLGLEIDTPPHQEQIAIADILDRWNFSVKKLEQLVSTKIRSKRGLMQQLLTGRRRFKEFEGQVWKPFRLGQVFRERNEIGHANLDLLSITAQHGVVKRDTLNRQDTSSEDKSKYLRITPGDIGYNTMRMWQGVSGLSDYEGIVSPAYTICIPTEEVDGQYARHLFKHEPVIHLFRRYSQGLVDDTLSLKFDSFSQIRVQLPEIGEQRRIASVLNACDREIDLLKRQLSTLKKQKQGLMQQLLTGRVRVPALPQHTESTPGGGSEGITPK